MDLGKDLRELLESLRSSDVEFIVVGAHALACYAEPRATKDLDLFIRSNAENLARLRKALDDFGFGAVNFDLSAFLNPKMMLTLGVPPNQVEIMNSISGISFEDAWEDRVVVDLQGLEVAILSRDHLIKNKTASGRPQDLVDVAQLMEFGPDSS